MPDEQENDFEACENAIYSNDYADLITTFFGYYAIQWSREQSVCTQFLNQFQKILHVRYTEPLVNLLPRMGYRSFPKCYGLEDTASMEATGVLRLRRQPYVNLYGDGVIFALIDTGIDYTNPLFRNEDGTTRILEIWDQTIRNGPPPESFAYGTQYRREQINEALLADNPFEVVPSRDEIGHGTFAAGLAVGREDPENDFTGAAPRAEIVAVKLKPAKENLKEFFGIRKEAVCFQETDILLALNYVLGVAEREVKPVVVYFGIGTNSGDHNGNSALETTLTNYSGVTGVGIVAAAGNEANQRHHYSDRLEQDEYVDVELQVGENEKSLALELWASVPLLFSAGFISPSGEVIERIPARLGRNETINFLFEGTKIFINYEILESSTGDELIFIRFESPAAGIWRIRVYNDNSLPGDFHMWLPMEGFISPNTFFLRPDPDVTICGPGNARDVITTAGYNYRNNGIYINSGRGYTRLGMIKPVIAAPAVDIAGPVPGGGFGTRSGTSIGAAHTAGVCIQLMEWGIVDGNAPQLTTRDMSRYIVTGARRLPGIMYPNREWGFGILDIMSVFENMRVTFP